MVTTGAGNFKKCLVIGEESCLVEGYVRRNELEEKATTKS